MEFMVEIVITAFSLGGILGAVVALHLSANLKQPETSRPSIEISSANASMEFKQVPVKIQHQRTTGSGKRRR